MSDLAFKPVPQPAFPPQPSQPIGHRVSNAAIVADIKEAITHPENLPPGGKIALGAAALAGTAIGAGALLGGLVGAAIGLPNNKSYVIKDGDTLESIAKATLGKDAKPGDVTKFVEKTVKINSDIINNPNQIYTGDKIAVPPKPVEGKAEPVKSFIDE